MTQESCNEECKDMLPENSITEDTVQASLNTNSCELNQVEVEIEESRPLKANPAVSGTPETKVESNKHTPMIFFAGLESQQWFKSFKKIIRVKTGFLYLLFFLLGIVALGFLIKVIWIYTSTKQTSPSVENFIKNSTDDYVNFKSFTTQQMSSETKPFVENRTYKTHTNTPTDSSFSEIDKDTLFKDKSPNYLIGVGRSDITGPPADIAMMGYANTDQVAGGVHMRLFARSVIIGQGSNRFVFVSLDACMGSALVKLEILKKLRARYGNLYTQENVCITATHTHSAPSGFLQDVLFQITPKGFVPETFDAIVNGIEESIVIAHDNLAPGFIQTNKGQLLGSNINRSPVAYLNNPNAERKKYQYNVDKEMVLLKLLNATGAGIGMINWFPVHCTSMNNTNSLLSGDNKGYASLLFEQHIDSGSLAGKSNFVAIFAQSNEGDVSPNTKGPRCLDTGEPCDGAENICNGNMRNCVAFGPGKDMFESTKIIGERQFQKALKLYEDAEEFLDGQFQYSQQYIDMSNRSILINDSHSVRTCKAAMGFSFAAGTTDGPGPMGSFTQGDRTGNTFWKLVRNFIHSPSEEQVKCHSPKPILLDTGNMDYPYTWQSNVVDTQLLRIGRLLVAAVPGEFSTMAGRRLRESIVQVASSLEPNVSFDCVISGLANSYSDYVTTYEEYQIQRYEGASTVFGPHTLQAYMEHYDDLATSLIQGLQSNSSVEPEDNLENLLSFVPGVVYDIAPLGYEFGEVLQEPEKIYNKSDVVKVKFVSGNPRNSPRLNMTYLTVEKLFNNQSWILVYTDADWSTKYIWERSTYLSGVTGSSTATVLWEIPAAASEGYYRVNHFGHYKYFWNRRIYPYSGHSSIFYVF